MVPDVPPILEDENSGFCLKNSAASLLGRVFHFKGSLSISGSFTRVEDTLISRSTSCAQTSFDNMLRNNHAPMNMCWEMKQCRCEEYVTGRELTCNQKDVMILDTRRPPILWRPS
jgi:hypothetical protein